MGFNSGFKGLIEVHVEIFPIVTCSSQFPHWLPCSSLIRISQPPEIVHILIHNLTFFPLYLTYSSSYYVFNIWSVLYVVFSVAGIAQCVCSNRVTSFNNRGIWLYSRHWLAFLFSSHDRLFQGHSASSSFMTADCFPGSETVGAWS